MESYTIDRRDIAALPGVFDADEDDIQAEYTGRGMGDRTCLGVVCDDADATSHLLTNYLAEKFDLEVSDVDLSLLTRVDSMGRRVIAYWPNVTIDH